MTDVLTPEQRSYNMSQIKGRDTRPELVMREHLKGLRLRYHPKMYGNPDFASRKLKVAVFCDGCFWHGCRKCYNEPENNREFWQVVVAGITTLAFWIAIWKYK